MSNSRTAPTRHDFRKHVATVHVSGELSLLERKIVNVLLLNAYDELVSKKTHSLPVGALSTMLGFDSKNTAALKMALRNIMSTPLEFDLLREDGNSEWHATPLLAYAGVKDGVCDYEYSDWLARKLAEPESYTLININIQKQFNGSYALALYENCLRFRGTGSTGWISVQKWRKLLGADASMYDEFKHFSSEVIKKAVKEVNQVSNILITPEYEREQRRVVRIRFLVEHNPQSPIAESSDSVEAEIKTTETYKRLVAIGLGERLAVSLVQQDPTRAAHTAAYTEQQLRRKRIKGDAGGYARKVFENGNAISLGKGVEGSKAAKPDLSDVNGKPPVDTMANAKITTSTPAVTRSKATSAAIKALDPDMKHKLALIYLDESGQGVSYQVENRLFSDPLERIGFTNWLRQRMAAQLDGE